MLEEHLLPFLALLRERRYGIATIRTCRKVVCEFLVFLEGRIGRPEEITLDHWLGYFGIRSRLSSHLRERTLAPGYEKQCRNDLNLFLRYLVTKGIQTKIPLRQKKDLRAVPGYEDLLTRYERFLREHRGLKFKTINRLVDDANRLCRKMVETKVESWDALTPDVLYEHLRAEAQKLGYVALSHAQSALRSFFRYLVRAEGLEGNPFAAILTPTPDVFNQSLMAGPLIILYELGIISARLFGRRARVTAAPAA